MKDCALCCPTCDDQHCPSARQIISSFPGSHIWMITARTIECIRYASNNRLRNVKKNLERTCHETDDISTAVYCVVQFPLTTLVTWECTIRHAVPWAAVEAWSQLTSPTAKFMAAAMENSVVYERARVPPPMGWIACDPLAVALAAEHGGDVGGILTNSKLVSCAVELSSSPNRGQSVFSPANGGPLVRLVTQVDVPGFAKLLHDSMR